MNLTEFSALQVGDKIRNPMHDGRVSGEVVEKLASGVRVVWGQRHAKETRFYYSVVTTAWMSWVKPD